MSRLRGDPRNAGAEAVKWIDAVLCSEGERGRSMAEFLSDDRTADLKKELPLLVKQGFRVFAGNGNVFYLKLREDGPVAVHERPLAQRIVRPVFL